MDVVTDLTSQAVSYLSIIQDICKNEAILNGIAGTSHSQLWDLEDKIPQLHQKCTDYQKRTIVEIAWSSYGDIVLPDTLPYFFDAVTRLLEWLKKNVIIAEGESTTLYTPYNWRLVIRRILYTHPEKRVELSDILHYMPVLVILGLAKKKPGSYLQRLYQVWDSGSYKDLLNDEDKLDNYTWWQEIIDGQTRHDMALALLINDTDLLEKLNEQNIPLPFETLFNQELNEICLSRGRRFHDTPGEEDKNMVGEPLPKNKTEDPLERARRMNLYGLAFSGGGIRSATFNLGILQKLAEKDLLPRIDYISTVSGGGYIGTWYAAWIKRGGSVIKVADRLNKKRSGDPMGEEVRPVRWLRMFSNYLAPNASIMSVDAWTMGITWLRNTIINQVILLLLLCTSLSLINVIYLGWYKVSSCPDSYTTLSLILYSSLIILPGAGIAGLGMSAYAGHEHPAQSIFNSERSRYLATALFIWAFIASFIVSSWLYSNNEFCNQYLCRVQALIWVGVVGLTGMLFVAYFGYYHRSAEHRRDKKNAHLIIIGSSVVASAIGLALLALLWQMFSLKVFHSDTLSIPYTIKAIYHYRGKEHTYHLIHYYLYKQFWSKLSFTIGLPMILEIISCCVVVRMALMGRMFPDERREWWGRMGAITHRFSLIWLLVASGALLLPDEFKWFTTDMSSVNIPALFGGWAVIVGGAVKLAYQNKDDGSKPKSKITDMFIRFAPYLFLIGFLLLGAGTLRYVSDLAGLTNRLLPALGPISISILITLVLGLITVGLSMRVGVNEFSLHHFYRNRLVRGYMGGTRSRAERDRTANSFTDFDSDDDIKLAEFTTEHDYYGPFPILNTALNATAEAELDRQDRKAESFIFSPFYCGFDISPTRSAAYTSNRVYDYAYRPTKDYAYPDGPRIGTAMAISGAAVNPNMGYHSSSAMAFLLTIFNVRLGWWIGNPNQKTWQRSDPTYGLMYLVRDLVGESDISSQFVCLSDGGHFDNMGLYELIRRKCRYIILGDGEEDEDSVCEGLAKAIRLCRIDFGVEIDIDVTPITKKNKKGFCTEHSVKGDIWYPGDAEPSGTLIYIKTALTGDEDTDVREYYLTNKEFPQESTGDQFFSEDQFESYRRLGYHSVEKSEYIKDYFPG